MERSGMRDGTSPDCASLHPGYGLRLSIIVYPELLQRGAPARRFLAHEVRHLLRRAGADVAAGRFRFLLHRGVVEDAHDLAVWLGLVAPKGTPRAIVDKLNRAVVRILNDPAVKQRSESTGGYIRTSTPEEMTDFMRREAARWSAALKELGIRYD